MCERVSVEDASLRCRKAAFDAAVQALASMCPCSVRLQLDGIVRAERTQLAGEAMRPCVARPPVPLQLQLAGACKVAAHAVEGQVALAPVLLNGCPVAEDRAARTVRAWRRRTTVPGLVVQVHAKGRGNIMNNKIRP